MPSHVLRAAALAAGLLPALAAAAPLSLAQALDLAVQRSQATRSARAGAQGATEAARAAGQLPDPLLTAGVENLPVAGPDRYSLSRDAQTMKRIGISQEWVSADKRSARASAAEAVAQREAAMEKTAAADARLQTVLAYLDAYYAAEALKLADLMAHHAREELEAGMGRLASASGSGAEALALASAAGLAEDEAAEIRQQQSAAALALQRWVGVKPEGLVTAPSAPLPAEARYVAAHPTVVARSQDLEVARREASLAATQRRPNWTWEVSYGQRSGYPDMVSFGVSIPLAVAPAARQDRDTAAKLALVDKAEAELIEAQRVAQGEYLTLASEAQRLQERIERYRGAVLTPTRQRTAAATAAYRANQASLVVVFEARRAEVEAQRKLLTLQRDLAKAEAQLAYRPIAIEGAGGTP